MELGPVVDVVQIHGVARSGSVIGHARRAADALARGVVVDVTADRAVKLIDVALVKLHAGLLLHPALKLDVARLAVFDVIEGFLAIETKTIQNHLIVTLAAARIASSEFAAGFE